MSYEKLLTKSKLAKIQARLEMAGWPADFFSLLVKQHREFSNSSSVRTRGFYQGKNDKYPISMSLKKIRGKTVNTFSIITSKDTDKRFLLEAEDEREIILKKVMNTCKKHKILYAKTPVEFVNNVQAGLECVTVSPVVSASNGINIMILSNLSVHLLDKLNK